MTVAEATPDFEEGDRNDRAFLGHPKGLGYLSFVEACERFSYYSMQTLLTLYMVNYLLTPERMAGVAALDWLRGWHYAGLEGQPLASEIFGDYTSLVYLTPILGRIIADRFAGRRAALLGGGVMMSLGHLPMAIESATLFALLALNHRGGPVQGQTPQPGSGLFYKKKESASRFGVSESSKWQSRSAVLPPPWARGPFGKKSAGPIVFALSA